MLHARKVAKRVIKFSVSAFLLLAFSTKSKIFATVESSYSFSTRTVNTPDVLMQPLITSCPGATSRGTDSPVRATVFKEEKYCSRASV